jgi:hypothetical protein
MERGRSIVLALAAAILLAAAPTWAADDTTGKVSIETTSVAAGIGVAWGDGVLEYRGQRYPFTVTGFALGDVGVSKMVAKGEVYNLNDVADFDGTFMAAIASATLGAGAGAAAMQNQRDVKMVWTATNQGLSFSLAQAGINVKLADSERYQAAKAAKNGRHVEAEGAAAASPRPSR